MLGNEVHDQGAEQGRVSDAPMDEAERQRVVASIPTFASFEGHKENITPRKGGRSARQLADLYGQSDTERRRVIKKARDAFQRELTRLDELDDPLDVYIRHINWTMETFPQGDSRESKMADLYERAAQQFKDDDRYKSDPRYLNCWMQYLTWCVDKKEVFLYLMRKNIGTGLALFYERYAEMFESQKKYTEAKDALKLGIEKQARPQARLERGLAALEERIAANAAQATLSSSAAPSRPSSRGSGASPLPLRTPLGYKLDSLYPRSVPQNVFNNMRHSMPSVVTGPNRTTGSTQAFPAMSSLASSSSSSQPSSSSNTRPSLAQSASSSFQVFVDEEEPPAFQVYADSDEEEDSVPRQPYEGIVPGESSAPLNMPSSTRKNNENIMTASDFRGVILPQRHVGPPAPVASFKVFQDGEDDDEMEEDNVDDEERKWRKVGEYINDGQQVSATVHRGILEARFLPDKFISKVNTSDGFETISAISESLGSSGNRDVISFEEIRWSLQVDRDGHPQHIIGHAPQEALNSALDGNDSFEPLYP
ncbi:Mad3/BUB1 homology region 1-domain-containing protein [Gongronella butleri]|nr:Mad3/BUB1 homology region 1-domain-containing protein [Gongronella butleri]